MNQENESEPLKHCRHPKVSVIIPTFNRAWCLAEAVESVLAQTYTPVELIVVDDGSTDQTTAVLARYGSAFTVVRQENRGVSSARNQGAALASGEFLAFLDSDDYWLPGKLSAQMDFFTRHPGAGICQTEEIWVRNQVRVNPKKKHRKPSGDIFPPSLELCLVSPSAVMMRRALFFDFNGFDESLPACEDYDLWLRIGLVHPVYLIQKALIVKRGGHGDQLSGQPGLDQYRIRALMNLLNRRELDGERRTAVLETLAGKTAVYMNGCLKRGKKAEAAYYLGLLTTGFGVHSG